MTPSQPFNFDALRAPTLKRYFHAYETAVPAGFPTRNRALFPWCSRASKRLLLTSLPAEQADELIETNLLAILLNVMIDDLADIASEEQETLETALLILKTGSASDLKDHERFTAYLSLLSLLRQEILGRLSSTPDFVGRRPELLSFIGRFRRAMRRSSQWNRHWKNLRSSNEGAQHLELPRFEEFLDVMSPPIHSYVYGLINLMYLDLQPTKGSHSSERRGAVLEVLRCGEQYLAMSNWLATWRVEVVAGDYTSGIILWALEHNIVSLGDLRDPRPSELIGKIDRSDFRAFIEDAMSRRVQQLLILKDEVTRFDVGTYKASLEAVHAMHMEHREVLKS